MIDILSISLGKRVAITDDGDVLRITNFLDICGEETEDEKEAVTFVAGPNRDGWWFTGRISDYVGTRLH